MRFHFLFCVVYLIVRHRCKSDLLMMYRCLLQFLLYFTLHQMSIGLFRVMASLGRNMVVANTFGSFAMLVVMVLGGFILSRGT